MDRNNSGWEDGPTGEEGVYRVTRCFSVEDNAADVGRSSSPLGLPVAPARTRSPRSPIDVMSLHSMVPGDGSGSESSSDGNATGNTNGGLSASITVDAGGENDITGGSAVKVPSNVRPWENRAVVLSPGSDVARHGEKEKNISVSKPINAVSLSQEVIIVGEEKDEKGDESTPIEAGGKGTSSWDSETTLWSNSRICLHVLLFCNCFDLCNVMPVCRRFHNLATRDTLWKPVLNHMKLQPLLAMPEAPTQGFYQYFIEEIITTKAIHGHYFFTASTPVEDVLNTSNFNQTLRVSQKWGSNDECDVNGVDGCVLPRLLFTTYDECIYSIEAVTLRLSSASLGQTNHSIGRVQIVIRYKDKRLEIIQGAARFSWRCGYFFFSCSSFGSTVRGPIFTVAIDTVREPWPYQSMEQFNLHLGGLRLIMTPLFPEESVTESRINGTDLLTVSRAPLMHPGTQDYDAVPI